MLAALRIHVSPECKDQLDQFGTFQLEMRGPVTMKVFTATTIFPRIISLQMCSMGNIKR